MEAERKEEKSALEATELKAADTNAPASPDAEQTTAPNLSPETGKAPEGKLIGNAERFEKPATDATADKKDGKLLDGNKKFAAKGPDAQYDDPHLQRLHDNRKHKPGARAFFHLVNFGGLHQAFNNIASVVITYVMTTTNLADKMKDKMATHAIGKGLSTVLSLPGRAVNGVFKVCGVDLNKELNALPEAAKKAELEFRTLKSQRSAIETAFMCVAGFIALAPVYYLENHRRGFLNKVDGWLHPGRSPKEKEAASLKKGDEPKETLWNLFRARFIALAVVFGFDQTRDNIDSILKHKHESAGKAEMYKNVDTVFGWGLGNKIYDKLPEKGRSWLARFFSGKLSGDNVVLSKLQHEVRMDALKVTNAPQEVMTLAEKMTAIGKDIRLNKMDKVLGESKIKALDQEIKALTGGHAAVERAVFAEQSRLFLTKEVLLTTILSVVIYTCTKAAFAAHFMEKIGLAKKGTYDKEHGITPEPKHGKHARKEKPSHTAERTEVKEEKKEENLSTREEQALTSSIAETIASDADKAKADATTKSPAKLSDKHAPTASYTEAVKARKDSPGNEATVTI